MTRSFLLAAGLAAGAFSTASADTTDQTWTTQVVVAKQGDHCADDPNCCCSPRGPVITALANLLRFATISPGKRL